MSDVKVKRLEWSELDLMPLRDLAAYAKTPFGDFEVYEDVSQYGHYAWAIFRSVGGGYVSRLAHKNTKKIDTAKQRCQEYFERLVLECLEVDNE